MQLPLSARSIALATVIAAPLIAASPVAAQKTDLLVFDNGDEVTGEIKELAIGSIRFSTDAMGTVQVKQERVVGVTSDKLFEFELQSGETVTGRMEDLGQGRLRIVGPRVDREVGWYQITGFHQLEDTFWKRLDGSIDLGLGYLQASNQWDSNTSLEVRYTPEKAMWRLKVSSTLRTTDSVVTAQRQDANLSYRRAFAPRWFWTLSTNFASNRELSLDARLTGLGGAGRVWAQTPRINFWSWLGAGYSREKFTAQPSNNLWDAFVGADFQWFIRTGRKLDLTSSFLFIPSLSQSGRYRTDFDMGARYEFFKDFFVKLSVFHQFDSQPPTENARQTDFGLTTSLGWSFGT